MSKSWCEEDAQNKRHGFRNKMGFEKLSSFLKDALIVMNNYEAQVQSQRNQTGTVIDLFVLFASSGRFRLVCQALAKHIWQRPVDRATEMSYVCLLVCEHFSQGRLENFLEVHQRNKISLQITKVAAS